MKNSRLAKAQEFARKRKPTPDRNRKIATPLYRGCCLADHRNVSLQKPSAGGIGQLVLAPPLDAEGRSGKLAAAPCRGRTNRSGGRIGADKIRSHRLTYFLRSGKPTRPNYWAGVA